MSNVGYDMDTSGGLMPLIRALIKPPDEEPTVPKPKKTQHPYYKRPGKGHNHDSCDACGEGGGLICCDRCPASFHLGCYDPPLDDNDIPSGLWLCRECRASDAANPSSARGSRAQSPADSKSDTEKKTRTLRSRDSSKKQSKDDDSEEEKAKKEPEPEKELTPMEILVKAAKIMNPTQFELPREMRIPCIFPGTDKEGSKNGNASVVTVDSSGCVPLPAKSCYVCRGTCKMAPLLQCDYCPLLFHQDCLDPPLTALPTGRWMCPNHVEHFIDWKLVNSISATERVALWDKFSAPVDQHAIKIDFIRQARKYPPKFRQRVPGAMSGRVVVPRMVREVYARPPPLQPARRDVVRCRNVLNNLNQGGVYSESDDEDGPKHEICLNPVCVDNPELHKPVTSPHDNISLTKEDTQTEQENDDAKSEEECEESSEGSDSELARVAARAGRRRAAPRARSPPLRQRARLADGAAPLSALVDEHLAMVDEPLVRLLAWQRLRQILAGEQCEGAFRHTPVSAALARAVLQSLPPAPTPAPLVTLPSELLSRADRERIASSVWGRPPRPASPAHSPGHSLSDACVRAMLCPTRCGAGGGVGRPIPMRLAQLTVGAGGCDVRLDAARCRRVSQRHAVIFMDEVTRHFELINYSEFGTCVNGVMYACDVTRTPPAAGDGRDALRDLVSRRAPEPLRVNGDVTARVPGEHACRCAGAPPPGAAWEGSALVPHGALLQFGCLAYVFSIADGSPAPGGTPE